MYMRSIFCAFVHVRVYMYLSMCKDVRVCVYIYMYTDIVYISNYFRLLIYLFIYLFRIAFGKRLTLNLRQLWMRTLGSRPEIIQSASISHPSTFAAA